MHPFFKNKILQFFIILALFIILYHMLQHYVLKRKIENFIGKSSKSNDGKEVYDLNDDDKKGEKKSYDKFPPLDKKSKYDLINDVFGKNQPNSQNDDNHDISDNISDNISDDISDDINHGELSGIKDIPVKGVQAEKRGSMELEKGELQKRVSKIDETKPLLGRCNFYSNQCPANMSALGSLSGMNLKCGNNHSTSVQAEAIAEIHNAHVSKIKVIQGGSGYNPENPPKVTVEGGRGNGATAIAEVSDEGVVKSIDIVDYGYNYMETPKIIIEPPQMESVCYLCC